MAEDFAQAAHRVMMEATGRKAVNLEGGVENISSTLDKDYHYDFFEREIRDSL